MGVARYFDFDTYARMERMASITFIFIEARVGAVSQGGSVAIFEWREAETASRPQSAFSSQRRGGDGGRHPRERP
jgi:hypothetical protein